LPAALTTSSPDSLARRSGKTAFERNILPGFARWLVDEIERLRPNYLVPAETKGARLLETALAFARDVLGTQIDVPVIYGTALPYMARDVLRTSRVLIVDDAVRTGASLDRQRARLATYGAVDVHAVTCIGTVDRTHGQRVDSYLMLEDGVYYEYVWQLTELVVARGLPPEVDHLVFEVRLPERLSTAWPTLTDMLGRHGQLTADAPAERADTPTTLTLHQPALPGATQLEPKVAEEGARKLRLFPDRAGNRIFVIPVSFPALELAADTDDGVSPTLALDRIGSTMDGVGELAELLVSKAHTLNRKTTFRMLSACMEVDLVCALAHELARTFGDGVSITCQDELVRRLYGPDASEAVANLLVDQLASALAGGHQHHDPVSCDEAAPDAPVYLEPQIAEATRAIAKQLKKRYDDRVAEGDHDRMQRVGMALSEIAAELPGDDNALLASRCIDYGLALTTLVPYVDEDETDGGAFLVRRKYRVSEPNRGSSSPYNDAELEACRISEEVLALIVLRVQAVASCLAGAPVPIEGVAPLVAVLKPLTLDAHSIQLCARPGRGAPEILLSRNDLSIPINETSDLYRIEGIEENDEQPTIVPTERFRQLNAQDKLKLDVRQSAEDIEDHVGLLAPVLLGAPGGPLNLLKGWAMSADRRLGLSHVQWSLAAALAEMERPLRLILRGDRNEDAEDGIASTVQEFTADALSKLNLLSEDWAAPARERWSGDDEPRRNRRIVASLLDPRGETEVYAFPRALATLVNAIGTLVERLDAASAREWMEQGGAGSTAGDTLQWCAGIRLALTTLRTDGGSQLSVPDDSREALTLAADELLDVVSQIRAFAAALAGDYRGPKHGVATQRDDARDATALSVDIADSSERGNAQESGAYELWQEDGLNRAAQWARAFGGGETRPRKGDDLWAEYGGDVDAAILCAAAVQQQAAALRATDDHNLIWRFHTAVDHGRLHGATGDNTISAALNTASKLAKKCDKDAASGSVFTTRAALERCSPVLREDETLIAESTHVSLDGRDIEVIRLHPRVLMAKVTAAVQALGERIAGETPTAEADDPRVGDTTTAGGESLGPSDAATG
jgi:hypothetical protein